MFFDFIQSRMIIFFCFFIGSLIIVSIPHGNQSCTIMEILTTIFFKNFQRFFQISNCLLISFISSDSKERISQIGTCGSLWNYRFRILIYNFQRFFQQFGSLFKILNFLISQRPVIVKACIHKICIW